MLKTYAINLGAQKAGLLDLRAQLLDSSGDESGAAITTGFIDTGSGTYQWNYNIDPAFRGSVIFYSNAAPSAIFCTIALNPITSAAAGSSPTAVNAYLYVHESGEPVEGATLHYQQLAGSDGGAFVDDEQTVESDEDGLAEFSAVIGGTYRYWVNNGRPRTVTITEETEDPYALPAVNA